MKPWTIGTAALVLLAGTALAAPVRSALVGRPVAETRIRSLDGRSMTPSEARGRYLLYVFSDAKSRLLVRSFFTFNAARLAALQPLSIWSIAVPPKQLLPHGTYVAQARADAKRIIAEARNGLMSHQVAGFDMLDIRFHPDFNRETSAAFGVGVRGITLVLLDPNGYIVAHELGIDEPQVHRVIEIIKRRELAPGSLASGPPQARREVALEARQKVADYLGIQPRARGDRPADVDRLAVYESAPVATVPAGEPKPVGAAAAPAGASKKKSGLHYKY